MADMRMNIHYFALIYGIAFLLVGLAGFGTHGMDRHETLLFGIFPVNALQSMAHLAIGLAGIAVFFGPGVAALRYARVAGFVYLALGLIGLVEPGLFGLMPIGGADIALHLIAGGVALYFGYAQRLVVTRRTIPHI